MFSKIDKISLILVSISLLSLIVFFCCVYFPGKDQVNLLRNQIQLAKLSIDEFPIQVQNQQRLQKDIQDRNRFLQVNHTRVPSQADVHAILQQIALLAKHNNVEIIRLEPGSIIEHRCYHELPFQMEISGSTYAVQQFLYSLELQERLFKIENISLSGKSDRSQQDIMGEMNISIYTFYEESNDIMDNDSSSQRKLPI